MEWVIREPLTFAINNYLLLMKLWSLHRSFLGTDWDLYIDKVSKERAQGMNGMTSVTKANPTRDPVYLQFGRTVRQLASSFSGAGTLRSVRMILPTYHNLSKQLASLLHPVTHSLSKTYLLTYRSTDTSCVHGESRGG